MRLTFTHLQKMNSLQLNTSWCALQELGAAPFKDSIAGALLVSSLGLGCELAHQ